MTHNIDYERVDEWLLWRIGSETKCMDEAGRLGAMSTYAQHEYGRRLLAEVRRVLLNDGTEG